MASRSSASSSNPNTSRFWDWRTAEDDFGIGSEPTSTCQRRMTCAGVTPRREAAETTAGHSGAVNAPTRIAHSVAEARMRAPAEKAMHDHLVQTQRAQRLEVESNGNGSK